MAKEPEDLTLLSLREMRADMKLDFARLDETLRNGRRHVATIDMRVEALDEKFEMIREGTISAVGFAANASRARVDLQKQTRRVEKLEQAK